MNKAASVKLSLRKLLIATLAMGPLAILPSPLWAVPSTAQYQVTNGSVSLVAGATISTFTVSDKTVLVWTGNDSAGNTFNIPLGESWTFNGLSSSGAVLNKIGYNTNGTAMANAATAVISGNLNSTGRVFILANGNIVVNSGASIDTAGGLVLSTQAETSDFNFTTQGNLSFSGASTGSVTLGNTTTYTLAGNINNGTGTFTTPVSAANTTAVGVTSGGLIAAAGSVIVNNVTVAGDFLVNQTTNANTFVPATGITSGGNLTITTNNGTIGSTGVLFSVANGTTTLNAGAAAITVDNAANQFSTISVTNSGANNVVIKDADIVTLGASTVGQDLTVTAVGTANSTAIGSSGAVVVAGSATYAAGATSNSGISIGNSSSVGGTLAMSATNNSGVSFSGVGNLTTGALTAGTTTGNKSVISISTNGTLTVGGAVSNGGGNASSGGTVTLTGASVVQTGTITSGTSTKFGGVTLNATAGNITTGAITSNSAVTLNASAGSVNSAAQAGIITTSTAGGNVAVRTSSTGSADLSGNNLFASGQNLTFTGGNITVTDNTTAGILTLGTTNATGNVSITQNGTGATGLQLGAGIGTSAQTLLIGNVLTLNATSATGTITDVYTGGNYSPITVFGNVNLTTGGGAITMNSARQNLGISPTVQFGAITANTQGTAAATLAETSTLNIGGANVTTLTASSVSGNIVQSGAIKSSVATIANVGSAGTIALGNTSNNLTAITLNGGVDASATNNATTLTVNGPSSAPTNTTISSVGGTSNITIAAGSYNNLTVNAAGVVDISGVVGVSGNASLTGGNANNALAVPYALFGYPTLGVTVASGTSNLVTGTSVSGNRNIAYTTAPTLNPTTANFTVAPTFTAVLASDGTIGSVSFSAGTPNGTGNTSASIPGNATGITGGTVGGNITESAGSLIVVGTTTLNSPAVLTGANDFQGGVALANVTGWTAINDVNNLTVSGTSSALVTAQAGGNNASVASTWALSLGNLNVSSLTAIAGNGGGGNSGAITQLSGTNLHSENTASFQTTTGNIIIANAGNSAGRVMLSTGGGNNTVTYSEDGTIKLGNLNNGNGTVTLTARTGSIIEDTNANNTYSNNGTLSLQAVAGSILLGNTTTNAGNSTGGSLTSGGGGVIANAPGGTVALTSSAGNFTVNSVVANSFQLAASGNVLQTNAINVFGTANITAGGNVTLGNTSNNFGPILVNATGVNKNVSISESGTMNLRTITFNGGGNGTFTANSINGDIISSGFGGVRPGGNSTSSGTGVVTLTALKGNITVGDATTDFPTTGGVVVNGNNVSLTVLGNSTLVLGSNTTTSLAGNLTVTSAIGSLANAGNVVVSGNATFTTGNGNISLNQAGNQFGALKFSGNQVNIIQANDMKLLTGSSAIGASSLASGGAISIVNVGGVASFGSTLSLIATGNITLPKLIQVGNTLTVNAAGTKDLGALSISGDLSGKSPINLGTGAYTAPQP